MMKEFIIQAKAYNPKVNRGAKGFIYPKIASSNTIIAHLQTACSIQSRLVTWIPTVGLENQLLLYKLRLPMLQPVCHICSRSNLKRDNWSPPRQFSLCQANHKCHFIDSVRLIGPHGKHRLWSIFLVSSDPGYLSAGPAGMPALGWLMLTCQMPL